MSHCKRGRLAGASAQSAKRQRTVLSSHQKREIYEFYLEFCENQARAGPRSRQGGQNKNKPQNHSFVTASYHSRPREFETVGLATWKKVIKTGKEDGSEEKWQIVGRPTTLTSEEEATLAEHIKATALAGHLVTNNAIVIWALQVLAESPRFLSLTLEQQRIAVTKMGGKKWLRAFKTRHGIKLKNHAKPLETVRAKKSQPENVVDFFRNLLKCHALSHIHAEARRRLGQAGALNFEGVSLGISATSMPQAEGREPPEVLQAEICSVPALATWQPGVVDVDLIPKV